MVKDLCGRSFFVFFFPLCMWCVGNSVVKYYMFTVVSFCCVILDNVYLRMYANEL
jgi:hypothetical protein